MRTRSIDNLAHAESRVAALSYETGELQRYGVPYRILSGSLHYFRVHPDQWVDRLQRVRALGLNTVDTYIPWNFHEQVQGQRRFDHWKDVEQFITLADEIGLDVIVRPGPYICAEWDGGGLPAWLTVEPGMQLRSSYQPYLDEVSSWFDDLIPRLARLQRSNGGPIIAVQVENEYGSYGDDHNYMQWMRDALVSRGITELLYTADGPTQLMMDGGTVPGVLATATFGSHAPEAASLLTSRRNGEPFFCAEFWNGWFDHWGEKHHVRPAESAAESVSDILDHNGSVSIYMVHGGTNFGLWAGANHDGQVLQPTITSYDSHAPISESGELTEKFFALRELFNSATGDDQIAEPAPLPTLSPRTVPVTQHAKLLDALTTTTEPVVSAHPCSFEDVGQASGLMLYRATPIIPNGTRDLSLSGVHDRAYVFINGEHVGTVDTVDATVTVVGHGVPVRLDILVENQGRINYGPLLGQKKGILGAVRFEQRLVLGWEVYRLPLDQWSPEQLALAVGSESDANGPGFARTAFELDETADAFLALPGFGKGFVWVNGFLLGRYWEIGPQVTLYVPAPLLKQGKNTITLLEMEHQGVSVELRNTPELGDTEVYIETFRSDGKETKAPPES